MKVCEQIGQVRHAVAAARERGGCVALVPTMGALHEGHWSLVEAARKECDFVVVSIFVNPTQFAPSEDLAAYPRTPEADLAGCEHRGVDAVFKPSVEEMYGEGSLTTIHVAKITDRLCGRSRPGHFDGVCTVVAKLLNIVQPDRAYFGAKDFQQSVVVRRMVSDLSFATQIVVCPTVREQDGLAQSSRNAYLTPEHRRQSTALCESLRIAERMIRDRRPPASEVLDAIRGHLAQRGPEGEIDYVEIVDPATLEDVQDTGNDVLVALAVQFGPARLIDNRLVEGPR